MPYRSDLSALVTRQIASWRLSDFVWVEVLLRLNERLPHSPASYLARDPSFFEGEGMCYRFDFIDPENRLLIHQFVFQVFYHADEQTLIIGRGIHVTLTGS